MESTILNKIKLIKVIIYVFIIFLGTIRYSLAEEYPLLVKESATIMVGGWYPIFFATYNQAKVDAIVTTIKQNRVKRIVVTYAKNIALTNRIVAEIQAKSNFAVEQKLVKLKDGCTNSDHNLVTVIIYLKPPNLESMYRKI